jgi:putative transposase
MPNYRRLYVPGGTYFFTLTLQNRSSRLLERHFDDLRASWTATQDSHPFETIAACILPDHLHCVVTLPNGDQNFPKRIAHFKTGFTRRLPDTLKSKGRKGERGIWQSRFWEHAIRDERDLENCVNYTHINPVKHGLVADMDDWPHSTWHRYKKEIGTALKPPPSDVDPHDS